MNSHTLGGTIRFTGEPMRKLHIVALDSDMSVVAEAESDEQGLWNLVAPTPISALVAYASKEGIAATWAPTEQSATLTLPPVYACSFEFEQIEENVVLWLDPVSLHSFPDDHLIALRSHVGNIVDLHVGEYPCSPSGLLLRLQAGRYRLTGGRMTIRPSTNPRNQNLVVNSVLDRGTGQRLAGDNGTFLLEVNTNGHFVVFFGMPEST
jgi:hypothetical protein